MPKVINRGSFFSPIPIGAVLVARPSKWGNPFQIGHDGTREGVVLKYREYPLSNNFLMNHLHELIGKDLVCYCAPLPCHADVLLELANK